MSALTAQLDVPLSREAPAAARHAVTAVLAGWGFRDTDWLDAAAVVVSELVTNAVRHGGGCLALRLEAHDERVVVSVADGSSVVPRRRDPDGVGGRGIALIEALSAGWTVQNHQGGKRVLVELVPCPGVRTGESVSARGMLRP
ncbi:ATP-binding protein [Actinoplanes aureus]|jgi:anti-sigma regulatory factor (Ser/Thr protein kinase)|uniref:ATP-binding protein n=1 Tax=Actinoplanes aureus TaxID=2792083 RepID=A0A931C7R6_9ACTN|nr:ATP-binding protein [Actinoplanes aureus]MBG0561048.1 ATP-binding protein [Actinoplanes aureus]